MGIIPRAPRRNVIAIRRGGSRLYLSRTRMYLSRNAAGAIARRSSMIRLAIFLSPLRISACQRAFSIRQENPRL